MKRILWVGMGWFMLILSAHAASFDCAKAGPKVEHLICDNPEISKLDEELNTAYKTALQDEKQADIIKQAQKRWLKYRNSCKHADCVKRAYEMRLSSLAVTHVYEFSWGDMSEKQRGAEFTSGSIDMRKPGYPFTLGEGKGVEVCEIYRKNLEALGNPNLACKRRISPEYVGIIKLPDWRKLDLWENRNLWAQVEAVAAVGANSEYPLETKNDAETQREIDRLAKRYEEHAEQYHEEPYQISVAEMDVDNDGSKENVLREIRGVCGQHVKYGFIALFVLDKKGDSVDVPKSRPLFQDSESNPWDMNIQESGTIGNGSMYDMFSYKDKTYFDRWTWTGVWIYRISNGQAEAICRLN